MSGRPLLFVDASAGAAGDMLFAALIDAGVPLAPIRRVLASLALDGWTLRSTRTTRAGVAARRIDVRLRGHRHEERDWRSIRAIVRRGDLPDRARAIALDTFRRLFEAEGRVHGARFDRVHLHEAGGIDAVVDVVGVATALAALDPGRIVVSPLTTGFGRVRCAHGDYPVPAPATLELVRGLPVRAGTIEAERLTPTGAALLASIADEWAELPPTRPSSIGYGAGARDLPGVANVVRVVIGEPHAAFTGAAEIVVLECSIDDAAPQSLAHAAERLLAAGARDVTLGPLVMKKGRPGHLLRVLAAPDDAEALAELVFRTTPTLGLRVRRESRIELEREQVRVRTRFGTIGVKIGRRHGAVAQRQPEYDDCAAAALRHDVAIEDVRRAALRALDAREARTTSRPKIR